MSNKKLSTFTERALPRHVVENNPKFVEFVRAYFEYLEREFGEYDMVGNILDYLDIDTTVDEFLQDFKEKNAPNFPEKYQDALELKNLLKNIRSLQETKGTEASLKALFRAVFDTVLHVYYPKSDVLRCSAGNWIVAYQIKSGLPTPDNILYLEHQNIYGSVSGATGFVDEIRAIEDPGNPSTTIYVLTITNRVGDFKVGDNILLVTGEIPDGGYTPRIGLESDIITGDGYWGNQDGWLSYNKYLQDDYYQEFSYELQSNVQPLAYTKLVKDMIHPAGFRMYSIYAELGAEIVGDGTDLRVYSSHTLMYLLDYIDEVIVSVFMANTDTQTQNKSIRGKDYSIPANHSYDWNYFDINKGTTSLKYLYTIKALKHLTLQDFIDNDSKKMILEIKEYDSFGNLVKTHNAGDATFEIVDKTLIMKEAPVDGGYLLLKRHGLKSDHSNKDHHIVERFAGDGVKTEFNLHSVVNSFHKDGGAAQAFITELK